MALTSIEQARLAGMAADDKKGIDIAIIDVRKKTSLTEFFVFVGATSMIHVNTLEDAVRNSLRTKGIDLIRTDGRRGHSWRALDYGSFIVHIMAQETREFYSLERLWREGKEVPLKKPKTVKKKPTKKKPKAKKKTKTKTKTKTKKK